MNLPQSIDIEAARKELRHHGIIDWLETLQEGLYALKGEPEFDDYTRQIVTLESAIYDRIEALVQEESGIQQRERLDQEREDKSFNRTHRAGPGGI